MHILKDKIRYISGKIDEKLINYFSSVRNVDELLLNSVKYSITSKGKRLRPCLLVLFYELCGGKSQNIYDIACSIEMIHTYSLIHDDLPCMDNDEFRRGKKCNHIVYGENIALLAGDSLITQAFEVLAEEKFVKEFGENELISAFRVLAKASGLSGMISGQAADIQSNNYKNINENILLDMYRKKTGMLFSAAVQIGVICAGGSSELIQASKECGETLGVAFQLCDDISDYLQDNDKNTYVSLFGEENARKKVIEYKNKALKALEKFEGNKLYLSKLIEYLCDE